MKFSYNWISELVSGLDVPASELSNLITLKTAESEGVEEYGSALSSVVAARVEAVEAIDGSKNVKAVIDAGRFGKRTVVCGAPNCRPGIVTAYVPSGTKLKDGREIRKAVIGGIESDGMLASGAELGLNAADVAGILELTLEPGASIGVAPDWIIEIDNKSLTHRPDLWGHHGMAREVAAILRKPLHDPVDVSVLPNGDAGNRGQHRRLRSVSAVQRSGGRECHGPAVAFVAAVPTRGDRPESDQQRCRHHQLDHGRDRAADARVRCGQAEGSDSRPLRLAVEKRWPR